MSHILKLWEKGVPLGQAIDAFLAPDFIEKTRSETSSQYDPQNILENISKDVNSKAIAKTDLAQLMALGVSAVGKFYADEPLQQKILSGILHGPLVALGFSVPRKHGDNPVVIDLDVWAGKINWKLSEVSGNGLQYVSVRITLPSKIELIEQKKPGRPGIGLQIIEAWHQINAAGEIDFSQPNNRCYPLIRDLLAKKYPEQSEKYLRINDRTLQRHTKALFENPPTDNS